MKKEQCADQFIKDARAGMSIIGLVEPIILRLSTTLSDNGANVYYRLENLNHIGQFLFGNLHCNLKNNLRIKFNSTEISCNY